MKRYLIFNEQSTAASVGDAAHDTACWPLDRFLGFTNLAGHATNQDIDMLFRSLSEPDNPAAADKVTFRITDNKHMDFMKAVVRKINSHPNSDGAIVIYDAATGVAPELPSGVEIEAFSVTVENAS
jgi:hypothetical protein|tara:strand:- start:54 stop:431 length:378 start_codon:yes stop_codon:yes gene_type:complete